MILTIHSIRVAVETAVSAMATVGDSRGLCDSEQHQESRDAHG